MSELRIRCQELADEAAITAMWKEVFPGDPARNSPAAILARKRDVQPELLLVGEDEEGLVATVVGGYDGHRGWAYHLAVAPERQGRGYGKAMMRRLEQVLAERGCPKLNLQVRVNNLNVVNFYRHLGYEVEARVSLGKQLR
jgi:ribosomal protein S18 acetylase RimI-like enzyme